MKNYLSEINQSFPIRRKEEEKKKFRDYACTELGIERVCVEKIDSHNNIIIGDINKSRIIFTAHYDTPAVSLVPNFMFPANKISGTLIHLIYPILLSIVSLFVAFLIGDALGFQNSEWVIIYLALYYCAYFIPMMIPNKHNVNDNTSGVATVMSIARMVNNDKVAFILFDNEEKGLLGSKTFNKKHSEVLKDKLIVNFDCVGNGDQIIFAYKENAEKLYEYDLLCKSLIPSGKFDVHYLPAKKCLGNSDYKSFINGVGVMACKRGKLFKFYTDRIHTSKDTVADEENILFLAERMICLLEKL